MATSREHLRLLSLEIMITIISQLPVSQFLDIAHASSYLRQFLEINARTLCNTAIRMRYSGISNALRATHIEGWLLPQDDTIILSVPNSAWKFLPHPNFYRNASISDCLTCKSFISLGQGSLCCSSNPVWRKLSEAQYL